MWPNPASLRDRCFVQVVVQEHADGSYRLSDGGELSRLVGDDRQVLVAWLACAGADVALDGDFIVTEVPRGDHLAGRLLSFGHYLQSAPVLWQAEPCITGEEGKEREPSAVAVLADATRDRLVGELGSQWRGAIRRRHTVKGHGETTKAPLAVASAPTRRPLVVASFIDFEAHAQSIISAKRTNSYLFTALRDWEIPKFIVAKGSDEQIEQLADFHDPQDVTAIAFGDELLRREIEQAIPQLSR